MTNDTLYDDGVASRATYQPGILHPSDWAAIWLSAFILIVLILAYLVTWIKRAMWVEKPQPLHPNPSSYTTVFTLRSEDMQEEAANTRGIHVPYNAERLDTKTTAAPKPSTSRAGEETDTKKTRRKSQTKITIEDERKAKKYERPKRQDSNDQMKRKASVERKDKRRDHKANRK